MLGRSADFIFEFSLSLSFSCVKRVSGIFERGEILHIFSLSELNLNFDSFWEDSLHMTTIFVPCVEVVVAAAMRPPSKL